MTTFIDKDTDIEALKDANKLHASSQLEKTRAVEVLSSEIIDPLATINEYENVSIPMEEISFSRKELEKKPTHTLEKKFSDPKMLRSFGTESPCEPKPFYISTTSFYAKKSSYSFLRNDIETFLLSLPEAAYSYFPETQVFKVKFVCGSQSREIHISCFWDDSMQDHIVEVRRVHGDGIFRCGADLFYNLRKFVLQESEDVILDEPGMRSRTFSASPLPVGILPEITPDMFLENSKPAFSMAQEQFYEPRLESAKMICDLANKDSGLLQDAAYVQACSAALIRLVMDNFSDVREFGIVGMESFAKYPAYQAAFAGSSALLYKLVGLIEETKTEEFYLHAHCIRKATSTLCMIVSSQREAVLEQMMAYGFTTENKWIDYVNKLTDSKLREIATRLRIVYSKQ